MRSLLFLLSSLALGPVYANTCGLPVQQTNTNLLLEAKCPGCISLNDFAMTGAAVLFTNNHNRTIELSNGRNIVSVTLRRSTRNTPVTITILGFSYTISATNYAERLVDAVPVSGHLRESPWKRQPVPVSSLRSKCKEIEAEQEAQKVERTPNNFYNKYRQTDAYKEGLARGHDAYSRWQRMLDWEYILRTKYNSHRTICSPTHSGVRCDRYSRNFNGH